MTDAVVTRQAVETLYSASILDAVVTRQAVETLYAATSPGAVVTRFAVEVLFSASTPPPPPPPPQPTIYIGGSSITSPGGGFSTEFNPFNDTIREEIGNRGTKSRSVTRPTGSSFHDFLASKTANGDAHRQGVEITQEKYRFLGPGPKIWAGNIGGYTDITTLGQAPSWVEEGNNVAFTDKQRFNPIEYIDNANYPFPLHFNDGPPGTRETIVQVMTIPFWATGNEEADYHAFGVKGNIEDGNESLANNCCNNRAEQFINPSDTGLIPFLDEGQSYLGLSPTTCLTKNGDGSNLASVFVDFDGNINNIGSLTATISFDHVSGALNYVRGPGPKSALAPETQALGFVGQGFPDSPALTSPPSNFGGCMSSSVYSSEIDQTEMAAEALVYVSRKEYFHTNEGSSQTHVIAAMSRQTGIFGSAPIGTTGWALMLTTSDVAFDRHLQYQTVLGITFEVAGVRGTGGLDDLLNLDGWNHFAFARRATGGGNHVTDLYINGVIEASVSGSAANVTGSAGHRDTFGNIRERKLVVGGFEHAEDYSTSSGQPGRNYFVPRFQPGIHIGCLKIIGDEVTAAQITGAVDYEFLRSTIGSYNSGIMHEGFLNDSTAATFVPWEELGNQKLVDKLNTTDDTFLTILLTTSSLNLDEDIRERHGVRSATAGTDVYGNGQAQYGTDSLAFTGRHRGS